MIRFRRIITIVGLTFIVNTAHAAKCIPQVKKSNPPRLINGDWIKNDSPNQSEQDRIDFDHLMKKNYAFIFSGIYSKEASFSNKKLSFIQTKKIWQGKVPKNIDLDMSQLPTDPSCSKLEYDKEYIFFAVLGPRSTPIRVKTFRSTTSKIKALLGKPEKQWLRGRLITTPVKK